MSPTLKSDWVILYKIEGAKQIFIKSSKIKIDTVTTKGKKQTVGAFNFTLPKETKAAAYRGNTLTRYHLQDVVDRINTILDPK